jgi:hypothetical protein
MCTRHERICGIRSHPPYSFEQVGVGVRTDRHRRVPQDAGNQSEVGSGCQQQRGSGVTEVVESRMHLPYRTSVATGFSSMNPPRFWKPSTVAVKRKFLPSSTESGIFSPVRPKS